MMGSMILHACPVVQRVSSLCMACTTWRDGRSLAGTELRPAGVVLHLRCTSLSGHAWGVRGDGRHARRLGLKNSMEERLSVLPLTSFSETLHGARLRLHRSTITASAS